ncbi:MAG: hypothetical protein R3B84_17425 [Zavarzinella sp.]
MSQLLGWTTIILGIVASFASIFAQENKKEPEAAEITLPLKRIVISNSGMGYFHHEGEVTGKATVTLRVNEEDVNDLILTLNSSDPKGKAQTVVYDNPAPADITLKSFRIDLTENPTLGNLLHQVRGESIDLIDLKDKKQTGMIVSVHFSPDKTENKSQELVSLMTKDGLTTVPVGTIKNVKFNNDDIQSEFLKALRALAAARGSTAKTVSVAFPGEGKRSVNLSYITDMPIWKPTYRFLLGKESTQVKGLAVLENTTEQDWNNVQIQLVSGKPITFKMNYYYPMFVERSVIQPRLFGSVLPPLYQAASTGMLGGAGWTGPNLNLGYQTFDPNNPRANTLNTGGQFGGQFGGGGFSGQPMLTPLSYNSTAHYGGISRPSFKQLFNQFSQNLSTPVAKGDPKLTPADALKTGSVIDLGENFIYNVSEPVTLPRLKSAMVPIVNETVDSKMISIYNPSVFPKHPLKGFRITNTSKQYFAEGPIAVYQGDQMLGQARLPDVKPGETQLIGYAVDLDTIVSMKEPKEESTLVSTTIVNGNLEPKYRNKRTTTYLLYHKGDDGATVWLTQPIAYDWNLLAPAKATEQTAGLYRFEVVAPPRKETTLDVVEEKETLQKERISLTMNLALLERYSLEPTTPPNVKQALAKIINSIQEINNNRKQLASANAVIKTIFTEQDRIRENLRVTPKESEAYQRYLKKFDEQETVVEKERSTIEKLNADHDRMLQEFNKYTTDLNVK